jgi:uncharacterized membrane protein YccF (DUF307 family)
VNPPVNTFLNVLWLILGGGFVLAVWWVLGGLLLFATVVGIPFGVASFRLANYVLWPFGRDLAPAETVGGSAGGSLVKVANVIWFLFVGLWLALAHWTAALSFFVSVIGIPFGLAHVKIGMAALAPLGKRVVERR